MCVRERAACRCIHLGVCMERSEQDVEYLFLSSTLLSRGRESLITVWSWLAGHWDIRIYLSLLLTAKDRGTCHHVWIFDMGDSNLNSCPCAYRANGLTLLNHLRCPWIHLVVWSGREDQRLWLWAPTLPGATLVEGYLTTWHPRPNTCSQCVFFPRMRLWGNGNHAKHNTAQFCQRCPWGLFAMCEVAVGPNKCKYLPCPTPTH